MGSPGPPLCFLPSFFLTPYSCETQNCNYESLANGCNNIDKILGFIVSHVNITVHGQPNNTMLFINHCHSMTYIITVLKSNFVKL